MVPSRCGKDCSTCDLIGLCGGCHRYCLVERCLRRGYAVPGLTGDCNSCPFYECPKSRLGEMFESPLGAKTSRVRIKARVRKLPLFVPMIDVWGSDRWKGVRDVKAIAVKFHDLYERYGLLEEDIHTRPWDSAGRFCF